MKLVALAIVIAAVALGGAGVGVALIVSGDESAASASTETTMNTSRVTSVTQAGGSVTVQGQTTTAPGENIRTLWFQTVAGLAEASRAGATGEYPIIRKALNGSVLVTEEKDSLDAGGLSPFASITRSESYIEGSVDDRVEAAGARLVEVNFVPVFGGIAEIVVDPDDDEQFVTEAAFRVSDILGELRDRSYMVTVQNSSGGNLLIHANVLTRDGGGLGTAWQA